MAHLADKLPWHMLGKIYDFDTIWRKTDLFMNSTTPNIAIDVQFGSLLEEYGAQERVRCNIPEPSSGRYLKVDEVKEIQNTGIPLPPATMKKIASNIKMFAFRKDPGRQYRSDLYDQAEKLEAMAESNRIYWSCFPQEDTVDTMYIVSNTPFADEVCNALILDGEMRTAYLISRYRFMRNTVPGALYRLRYNALMAYMCLNVFYMKPELYTTPDSLYRRSASFQYTVARCTAHRSHVEAYDASALFHQEFFTFAHMPYNSMYKKSKIYTPNGEPMMFGYNQSFADAAEEKYQARHDQACTAWTRPVFNILGKCGLPAELALMVVKEADYGFHSRLCVPEDPLNPDNLRPLQKYLHDCWMILVRTNMLQRWSEDRGLQLASHLEECVDDLWAHRVGLGPVTWRPTARFLAV